MNDIKPNQAYSKWEKRIVFFTLLYIIVSPILTFIEKKIFWGEFFVLISFFSLFKIECHRGSYQKPILFLIIIWLFLFPLYGILIGETYFTDVFEPIFLIRHAVFFYFALFFFFAFKYSYLILFYLKKYVLLLTLLLAIIVLPCGGNVGYSALLGLMLAGAAQNTNKKNNLYFYHLGLALLIMLISAGAGTNKFILAFCFGFFILVFLAHFWRRLIPKNVTRIFVLPILVLMVVIGIKFMVYFQNLTTQMALLGQTIGNLGEMSHQYYTDLSGFWRLVLWSHLYGRFLEFPWGLGIGTPLFANWLDGFVLLHLYRPGENYVQGAHNSFVTFIARLGIPALILFSYLFFCITKLVISVFDKLDFRPFQTREGKLLTGIFFALAASVISSSFNVALESPLHASTFWFCLGLFTRLFGDYSYSTSFQLNLLDAEP